MNEKDDEIAHLSIVARTAKARNYGVNWHKLAIRHGQATYSLSSQASALSTVVFASVLFFWGIVRSL